MSKKSVRKIQSVCFALSHIPMAAILTALLWDGADGDIPMIALIVVATVITAVALVIYLGRTLTGTASATPERAS